MMKLPNLSIRARLLLLVLAVVLPAAGLRSVARRFNRMLDVRAHGCDEMHSYYFSRPLAEAAFF